MSGIHVESDAQPPQASAAASAAAAPHARRRESGRAAIISTVPRERELEGAGSSELARLRWAGPEDSARAGRRRAERTPDRVELRLDEAVVAAFLVELRQSGLIGGTCLACASRRGEDVASQVFVHAGERLVVLRIERAERVVVLLLVELQRCEAHTSNLLELILGVPVDHIVELRGRACGVAGIEQELRHEQRAAWRVTGAAELLFELSDGFLRLGHVVRLDGAADRGIEDRRLVRLPALPPAPRLHREDAERDGDGDTGNQVAPLVPPGLEVVNLFLFFEIVDCHARLS